MVIKERTFRNEDGKEVNIKICCGEDHSYYVIFEIDQLVYVLTSGSKASLTVNYQGFKIDVVYTVFLEYIVEEEIIDSYVVERKLYK